MLVYVTSLYSVRDDYLPALYQNFQQLLPLLRAPIYVFTDRPLPFSTEGTNVHTIMYSLPEFETYRMCLTADAARLPLQRNPAKDTAPFMGLMNTKVEMLWRAMPFLPAEVTHVAWIDAGITKILKEGPASERIKAAFAAHPKTPWSSRSVSIPGCVASPLPPSSDWVCWRFCGGFFVIPTSLITSFYGAVNDMLATWLRAGHLAWEVNIWAALEWKERAWFTWWGGDHDETMLEPPGFLTSS